MTEHLSTRQVEGYRDRSLSAAELLSACDHVAGCESCASRLAADVPVGPRVELLRADIEAGREPRHLSYEELADLVDGRLHPVDREIVESHLSLCGPCTEEARDLALAARRVEGRSSPRRPAVRFVAALAAAATLVSFAWLVDRALRVDGLRKQVAALQPANRTLGEEAPAIPLPPAKVWPPPMTLVDQGGRRVALDANGELTGLPALDPSLRVAVERALSTGEVQTPAFVAALVGHAETLLGPQEAGSFALLSPVGTAVSTDRPTFSWRPLSGARHTPSPSSTPATVLPPSALPCRPRNGGWNGRSREDANTPGR